MAKVKISDAAKQLGTKSNEVIRVLEKHGIDNNGKKFAPNSSVEEEVIEKIKSEIKKIEEVKLSDSDKREEAQKQKIYMVSNPQNSQEFRQNKKNTNQNQNRNNTNKSAPNSQNNRSQMNSGKAQHNVTNNFNKGQNAQPNQNSENKKTNQQNTNQERENKTQMPQKQPRTQEQNRTSQNQGRPQNRFNPNNRNNNQTQSNNNNTNRTQNRPNKTEKPQNEKSAVPQLKIPEPRKQESAPEKRSPRPEKRKDTHQENSKNMHLEKSVRSNNQPKRNAEPKVQIQEVKEPEIKEIILPEIITIKELAEKMKIQPAALIKKLFLQGKVVTVNQEIDFETAEEIALGYDMIAEKEVKIDAVEELLKEEEEDESTMVSRPPVICVMGHVDHGKTSLLDAIRSTNVIAKEAGGITQHIGAYVVEINGQKITFLDTPGHEAFTAMRMRGAQSTDIAILVVAADDGVMPQTIEAINHAKAAEIEIIVAINKVDKPSANIERVKQELIEHGLVAEDWGGSTVFVPVSAKTHDGIENLLEMILLTAEVKELKANPKRRARGLVIEAQLDKGKGPVATVLVQKGTLRIGDAIAAASCHGKVRAMIDDKGRRLKEAGPSTPVEILGLNDVPNAGEIFVACENEKEARTFSETFISQGKERLLEDTKAKMSLDDLFSQIKAGNVKELNVIVKADVQGSVEAIRQSLEKLSNEEVVVKVIHGGVGAVTESDVSLASASNAIIIGFNVRPDNMAKSIAERENVDLRLYKVIYNAIEDVQAAMKGMLDPTFEEKVIGHAEVRQTFKASGVGTIAGSYVLDGRFQRGCSVRITREGDLIFDGALASLKRFKDDVKEVNSGYECGLVFEKYNDIKEGDVVEAYIMEEVPR